ncbi:MAG TPA: hypothetical protein PKD50_25925, partial [Leptospiraceae bacterium]|nr:hypothetical protein [Leptospiraceae bacterium]
MITTILSILLLPFRLLKSVYFVLFTPFQKGDHILIRIPESFASYQKTSLVEWVTGKDSEILLIDFLNDLELISKSNRIKKV